MKTRIIPLSLAIVWLISMPVNAYELATHGVLTDKAYERSSLTADPRLLKTLGIDATNTNVFGETYYDISGNDVNERRQNDFERSRMPNEGRDFLTVKGWLLRGAIREDDIARVGLDLGPLPLVRYWVGPNPQDDQDPPRAFWRVMHHFYDPVRDSPLRLTSFRLSAFTRATGDAGEFFAAPSWALGVRDAFQDPNTPHADRPNHYSLLDAREAMYRALTGKSKDGQDVAATEAERNKYWATTFRALGNVVHLIQDMAQPQHTRNRANQITIPRKAT